MAVPAISRCSSPARAIANGSGDENESPHRTRNRYMAVSERGKNNNSPVKTAAAPNSAMRTENRLCLGTKRPSSRRPAAMPPIKAISPILEVTWSKPRSSIRKVVRMPIMPASRPIAQRAATSRIPSTDRDRRSESRSDKLPPPAEPSPAVGTAPGARTRANTRANTATPAADWVSERRQSICRNRRYTAMAREPTVTKR